MVISDRLTYADLFATLEPLAAQLGRAVNPTVYSRAEWARCVKARNAFVVRVLARPKVWLFGEEDDLTA